MAITLSANFQTAFNAASIQPVIWAQITSGADTATFVTLTSPPSSIDGFASISGITAISPKVDPYTRKTQTGGVTLRLADDGSIRSVVSNATGVNPLKGKQIEIKLGEQSMSAASDFAPLFKGLIDDVVPSDGYIDLICVDVFELAKDRLFAGAWVNSHPLEVVSDLLINGAGVPSAQVDSGASGTIHPDTNTAISHFCMTSVRGVGDWQHTARFVGDLYPGKNDGAVEVRKVIDAVASMLGGSFYADQSGVVKFRRFDPTAAISRTWTGEDYSDIAATQTMTGMVNQVVIDVGSGDYSRRLVLKDSASITRYGRTYEQAYTWPLGGAISELQAPASGAGVFELGSGVTTITLIGYQASGFSGTRDALGSPSSAAAVSGSRLLYLKLGDEIISCPAIATDTTRTTIWREVDANGELTTSPTTQTEIPNHLTLTSCNRGQLGSSAAAHRTGPASFSNHAVDLTMAVDFALLILRRFSNGAPIIECNTSLQEIDLEVGDFVGIDWVEGIWPGQGLDGFDQSVDGNKFEVIEKSIDVDSGSIKWRLCVATIGSPISLTEVWNLHNPAEYGGDDSEIDHQIAVHSPYFCGWVVDDGLAVSDAGGRNITIATGVAKFGPSSAVLGAAETITLDASKDHWIGIDCATRQMIVQTVTTSANEPEISGLEVRLAYVQTDSSDITTLFDLRNHHPISPGVIASEEDSAQNLVKNGSFEAWCWSGTAPPSAWTLTAGVWQTVAAREAGEVGHGRYSIKFPASTEPALKSDLFPIDQSGIYYGSFLAKGPSGSREFRMRVYFFQADRTTAASTASIDVHSGTRTTTGWVAYASTFSTPSNAAWGQVELIATNHTGSVYIDKVAISRATPTFSAYLSGNQTVTSTSPVTLTFNAENFDHGGIFDHSTDYAFECPQTGTYNLRANLAVSAADSSDVQLELYNSTSTTIIQAVDLNDIEAKDGTVNGVLDFTGVITNGHKVVVRVDIGTISSGNLTILGTTGWSTFQGRQVT
mgnify:CR=1 FL=1